MAVPRTYLHTPPAGCPDPVGRAIPYADLMAGLKRINPRISAFERFEDGLKWPGKKIGKTCIWLGDPGGESVKISATTMSIVPEFTQMRNNGMEITKGWRAIFEKCILAGACTRAQIEAEFKVNLTIIGEDVLCRPCVMMGKRNFHNGGVLRLCKPHENIARAAATYLLQREALHTDLDEVPTEVKNVHV